MDTQKILYKKTYKHFKKRLFERYGITINFDEYINLHHIKLTLITELDRCISGFIIINNIAIKVIKSTTSKGKPLVTVLPLSKKDLFN